MRVITGTVLSLMLAGCGAAHRADPVQPAAEGAPAAASPEPAAPSRPLTGHLWSARSWLSVGADADLSSPPEGLDLQIDEARFGTEEEVSGPPQVTVQSRVAPEAASPAEALLGYGRTLGIAATAGCRLAVSRFVEPIRTDEPRRVAWTLVELCPLPDLDGAVTSVAAWVTGEDLSVGETGGVFLSVSVGTPLSPYFERGSIALDAPGSDYVLVQWRADPDFPDVLQLAIAETPEQAAPVIRAFVGHDLEIAEP